MAARFTPSGVVRPPGRGRPKLQAFGAYVRELVMICYEVLKNRTPFDPNWASGITT
jgi:hypothetical protein